MLTLRILLALCLILTLGAPVPSEAAPSIPAMAKKYKALLVRSAHAGWGLDAPVAVLAAQIHQESAWNINAVSPVGAQGLAQFMPSTAQWLPNVTPHLPALQQVAPFTPSWALLACVAYDKWLYQQVRGLTECDRMAFTLSAYNGGLAWVYKDQRLAAKKGLDRASYWGHVETMNAGRSAAHWRENRGYPQRILHELTTVYERAGWGQGVGCAH